MLQKFMHFTFSSVNPLTLRENVVDIKDTLFAIRRSPTPDYQSRHRSYCHVSTATTVPRCVLLCLRGVPSHINRTSHTHGEYFAEALSGDASAYQSLSSTPLCCCYPSITQADRYDAAAIQELLLTIIQP